MAGYFLTHTLTGDNTMLDLLFKLIPDANKSETKTEAKHTEEKFDWEAAFIAVVFILGSASFLYSLC
jgi:hypothetical protein